MKKYKITTAKNAVEKGLLKEGDEIWVKVKITYLTESSFFNEYGQIFTWSTIRIPIPEPKPIDFGEAGRVLKYTGNYYDIIYITTGKTVNDTFYAYRPDDGWAGAVEICGKGYWTDITDTYKP